jgi:hypothetical protein
MLIIKAELCELFDRGNEFGKLVDGAIDIVALRLHKVDTLSTFDDCELPSFKS